MEPSRRTLLQAAVAGLGVGAFNSSQAQAKYTTDKTADFILIKDTKGKSLARYLFGKVPAGETGPAVPYTDYTHPIWTPAGGVSAPAPKTVCIGRRCRLSARAAGGSGATSIARRSRIGRLPKPLASKPRGLLPGRATTRATSASPRSARPATCPPPTSPRATRC